MCDSSTWYLNNVRKSCFFYFRALIVSLLENRQFDISNLLLSEGLNVEDRSESSLGMLSTFHYYNSRLFLKKSTTITDILLYYQNFDFFRNSNVDVKKQKSLGIPSWYLNRILRRKQPCFAKRISGKWCCFSPPKWSLTCLANQRPIRPFTRHPGK